MRNRRGGRVIREVPATPWKPFEKARETLERLRQEQHQTAAKLAQLRADRETAITRDRDAVARSYLDRKAKPNTDAVARIDTQIASVTRDAEALDTALDLAEAGLVETVEQHRQEWIAEQEQTVETARLALRAAVEQYLTARQERAAEQALLRLIRSFPNKGYSVVDAPLAGLHGPHGGPHQWAQTEAALLADAEPDTRKPELPQPTYAQPLVGPRAQ